MAYWAVAVGGCFVVGAAAGAAAESLGCSDGCSDVMA